MVPALTSSAYCPGRRPRRLRISNVGSLLQYRALFGVPACLSPADPYWFVPYSSFIERHRRLGAAKPRGTRQGQPCGRRLPPLPARRDESASVSPARRQTSRLTSTPQCIPVRIPCVSNVFVMNAEDLVIRCACLPVCGGIRVALGRDWQTCVERRAAPMAMK